MSNTSLAQRNSEVKPVTLATVPVSTAMRGGFLAGLFNWYRLAKTILIYRSDSWLSVSAHSRRVCRPPYTEDPIWFVAPLRIGIGLVLCLRVRSVVTNWAGFAKWPIRFAFLSWVSVVFAGIGATLLSMPPPFSQQI